MAIIDAYTHFTAPNELDKLAQSKDPEKRQAESLLRSISTKNPHFIDVKKRLEDLDRYGIDFEVTMMQPLADPNLFAADTEEEQDEQLELVRVANDDMSQIMAKSRGRILTLGTAPLATFEDGGVEEMRRAWNELGLKGFLVLSNIRGKPIDQFVGFWEEAARLGAPVYIHPMDPIPSHRRSYEDEFDFVHVWGWPYETTLILSRLVSTGIMSKYPGLKVIAHHLGGMIPFFAGRFVESFDKTGTFIRPEQISNNQLGKKSPVSPSSSTLLSSSFEPFMQFYYDTAVGGSSAAVRCGLEVFGSSRLLFATDYPFGPNGGRSRLSTYPEMIRSLRLPSAEEKEIFEGNIRKIIRM